MRHHWNHDQIDTRTYTRRRFLLAGALGGVPIVLLARSSLSGADTEPVDPATAPPASTATSATPPESSLATITTTADTTTTTSPPTTTIPEIDHDLERGMGEEKVEWLQRRLVELGFDPGPVDGQFGEATMRAVWAFEKLVLQTPRPEVTGTVTPESWRRMNEPMVIGPRRTPGGTHVEVYLPEQVAALFIDGAVRLVTHISSGDGQQWCDEVTIDNDDGTTTLKGICGVSITPGGVYHFERKVDGWRNAALGRLYQPVYFNFGLAIHGATNVPSEPASHGCVRIPMHIAEYFPDLVAIGDAVFVFDGVEEPEHYGAQLPIFDRPDPNWVPPATATPPPSTEPGSADPSSTVAVEFAAPPPSSP